MNKGIVMEVNDIYAIVMNDSGIMKKISYKPGLSVGQKIFYFEEDIIRMDSSENNDGNNNESKAKDNVITLDDKRRKLSRNNRFIKTLGSIAALFLIVFTFFMHNFMPEKAYAVVTLDINPSIQMEVDSNKKIIKVEGVNDDGKKLDLTEIKGLDINEGINIGIVGRPNVGKSSLLNALIEEDKAIVTDIEGTTRDIVEGNIVLNGVNLNIIDTAGIRKTNNQIEKIGVDKSRKAIDMADLVIVVIDKTKNITKEDKNIIESIPENKRIIFLNKNDLDCSEIVSEYKYILGNTQNIDGIRNLKNAIINMFNLDQISSKDVTYLNNINQINIIKQCLKLTINSLNNLKNKTFIDIIEIDIRKIWDLLGELIGENYDEELLDNLFKNFCLGK